MSDVVRIDQLRTTPKRLEFRFLPDAPGRVLLDDMPGLVNSTAREMIKRERASVFRWSLLCRAGAEAYLDVDRFRRDLLVWDHKQAVDQYVDAAMSYRAAREARGVDLAGVHLIDGRAIWFDPEVSDAIAVSPRLDGLKPCIHCGGCGREPRFSERRSVPCGNCGGCGTDPERDRLPWCLREVVVSKVMQRPWEMSTDDDGALRFTERVEPDHERMTDPTHIKF